MLTQLIYNTLIILSIISTTVYPYSACDDIDIHFMIDTDSIIQNSANIEKFIQSIVWNGTSEYTAISISLYGDNILSKMKSSIIISLHETHSIYQRAKHAQKLVSQLRRTFKAITFKSTASKTSVTLSEAFTHSNDQPKPMRLSKKESLFTPNKEESTKLDEYFVFDHYNKLVSDNDDICSMIYHDRVINKNMHFIMGQTFTKKSIQIHCNNGNVFYDRVDHRTFFALPDIMDITNNKHMETVLDITCPTDIDINEEYKYGAGDLSLSNHVQWIEAEDIIKCKLVKIKNKDKKKKKSSFVIDSESSYIKVKNYNDHNTYKVNDYLLVHKDESKVLSKLGCWSPVYKIVDIKEEKLFISLPSSPTEYIMRANISGKHPLFSNKNKNKDKEKRRLVISRNADIDAYSLLNDQSLSGSVAINFFGPNSKTIPTLNSYDIKINGSGSINATLDYELDINIDLDFDFNWNLLQDAIYLLYTLNNDYSLLLDLYLNVGAGGLHINIDDLFNIADYLFFFLGPVPIAIEPFVDIDLDLDILPLEIGASVQCTYGGIDQIGYKYDYKNNYVPNYGIIKRDTKSRKLIIVSWEDVADVLTCASLNFGFDGLGVACNYFDYNPNTGLCRCAGTTFITNLIDDDIGTTLYGLNEDCAEITTPNICLCSILDITISSNILGCAKECIRCTNNPGQSEENILSNDIQLRLPGDNNGCQVSLEIPTDDFWDDLTTCPVVAAKDLIGLNIAVDLDIGANLFDLITVYIHAILDVPLRVNVPEFNNAVCPGVIDSCIIDSTEVLTASTDVQMDLELYLGVDIGILSQLQTILNTMIDTNVGVDIDDALDVVDPLIERLIGQFNILPLTNMACLPFTGSAILDNLNTFIKGLCCEIDSGDDGPIFIDDNNNGINDRNEGFNGENSSDDANLYEISGFAIFIVGFIAYILI